MLVRILLSPQALQFVLILSGVLVRVLLKPKTFYFNSLRAFGEEFADPLLCFNSVRWSGSGEGFA